MSPEEPAGLSGHKELPQFTLDNYNYRELIWKGYALCCE